MLLCDASLTMYICIIICDNVTYEGFRVFDYLLKKNKYKA